MKKFTEKLIINKDTEILRDNDNELRYDDLVEHLHKTVNSIKKEELSKVIQRALDTSIDNLTSRKFIYLNPNEKHFDTDILIEWGADLVNHPMNHKNMGNMKRIYIDHILDLYVYIFTNHNLLDPGDKGTQYVFFINHLDGEFRIYQII